MVHNTEFREQHLTLSLLMKELAKVKWQWRTLGIQLGVDPKKVKEFEDYTEDVKYFLCKTLQFWLEFNYLPTIQDLLDALRSPVLNHHSLADELEKKYKGNGTSLASFPGSSALEREIEFIHAERAWYFFSRENPQR